MQTPLALLEIRGPSFTPLQSHALSFFFKLYPPLSLPSSFPRSFVPLISFFLFFSIRSPPGKKVETFPTFPLSPIRPRAQFCRKIPLRSLLWRTWARSRNKTTMGDLASLVCLERFYRFRRPYGMFFPLARFLFRPFLSNVHEEYVPCFFFRKFYTDL